MNKQLLKVCSPLATFSRARGYAPPPGGIKYPGGITYYPRSPDHTDPEYTPSKLFRVERIKSLKHQPWYLKLIMKQLKIDEELRVTILKNIPEMNSKLWKVKHLIKVTPITFPYGEPSAEDIKYTILKENGQCIVTKTLAPKVEQIEALDNFDNNKKKMDSTTIKRDSRRKWNEPFNVSLYYEPFQHMEFVPFLIEYDYTHIMWNYPYQPRYIRVYVSFRTHFTKNNILKAIQVL